MSRYQTYLDRVVEYRRNNPHQRDGQAHYNVWACDFDPHGEASVGLPDSRDPFYDDDHLPAFLEFVREQLATPDISEDR